MMSPDAVQWLLIGAGLMLLAECATSATLGPVRYVCTNTGQCRECGPECRIKYPGHPGFKKEQDCQVACRIALGGGEPDNQDGGGESNESASELKPDSITSSGDFSKPPNEAIVGSDQKTAFESAAVVASVDFVDNGALANSVDNSYGNPGIADQEQQTSGQESPSRPTPVAQIQTTTNVPQEPVGITIMDSGATSDFFEEFLTSPEDSGVFAEGEASGVFGNREAGIDHPVAQTVQPPVATTIGYQAIYNRNDLSKNGQVAAVVGAASNQVFGRSFEGSTTPETPTAINNQLNGGNVEIGFGNPTARAPSFSGSPSQSSKLQTESKNSYGANSLNSENEDSHGSSRQNWQEKDSRGISRQNWQEKDSRGTSRQNWHEKDSRATSRQNWQEKYSRETSRQNRQEKDSRGASSQNSQDDDSRGASWQNWQEKDSRGASSQNSQDDDSRGASRQNWREKDTRGASSQNSQDDDSGGASRQNRQEKDSRGANSQNSEEEDSRKASSQNSKEQYSQGGSSQNWEEEDSRGASNQNSDNEDSRTASSQNWEGEDSRGASDQNWQEKDSRGANSQNSEQGDSYGSITRNYEQGVSYGAISQNQEQGDSYGTYGIDSRLAEGPLEPRDPDLSYGGTAAVVDKKKPIDASRYIGKTYACIAGQCQLCSPWSECTNGHHGFVGLEYCKTNCENVAGSAGDEAVEGEALGVLQPPNVQYV